MAEECNEKATKAEKSLKEAQAYLTVKVDIYDKKDKSVYNEVVELLYMIDIKRFLCFLPIEIL